MKDKVKDFVADATDGEFRLSKRLADSKSQLLVLFFYPRDNTSGCTLENQDFAGLHKDFIKAGVMLAGISRDTLKSHHKFADKFSFPFPLIADPEEEVCNMFDVMKDKNMYGKMVRGIERSTFIIDAKQNILHEWRKVKVPGHADEVFAKVKELL